MTTKYAKSSPYANTPQSSWFLSNWSEIKIPSLDTDRLITLTGAYKFRPDLLSYDLYGDPHFWWVFSVRNPNVIKDPIYDFIDGIQIYVTDRDTLLGLLNA